MDENITASLLTALAKASPKQQQAALRYLNGEPPAEPAGDESPLLYSVSQAARRLNVSRSTIWRICKARNIRKIELYPGAYRIRRADVEAVAGVHP